MRVLVGTVASCSTNQEKKSFRRDRVKKYGNRQFDVTNPDTRMKSAPAKSVQFTALNLSAYKLELIKEGSAGMELKD
jgi:hypothetical protein